MDTKPSDCEIRPASETDYDAIAAVWHSSASLPDVGPAAMPTFCEMRERIGLETAAGWVTTVAIRGGDVVGFAAIKPRDAVLAELFIKPGFLGAGVGNLLLDHCKTSMPEGFTLHTRATNHKARRFYERAGLIFLRDGLHPRTSDPVAHYGWNVR